jgi:serine/threonine protein kinase
VALLKGIHHPNIVQFMGLCKHDSGTYLVTEFVAGGNLKDFLERNDPPWKMRVIMAMDIAVALNFMHKKGLVYRDIKPENLLLTENGRIKVCDLGLARTQNKMNYMTIAGSDDYMAPEVLLGEKYDEKCDVFGFGVLLGVIVARKKMPMRKEKTHYAFDLRAVEKLIPPGCPSRLKQLVIDCCKANPNDRPDFKEALNMLKDIQKEVEFGEDGRGDRGRSASVTQFSPYQQAGERDRAYTVSHGYGAGYEQPPLAPSVVRDDDSYDYSGQGSEVSSGQASGDNYAFFNVNGWDPKHAEPVLRRASHSSSSSSDASTDDDDDHRHHQQRQPQHQQQRSVQNAKDRRNDEEEEELGESETSDYSNQRHHHHHRKHAGNTTESESSRTDRKDEDEEDEEESDGEVRPLDEMQRSEEKMLTRRKKRKNEKGRLRHRTTTAPSPRTDFNSDDMSSSSSSSSSNSPPLPSRSPSTPTSSPLNASNFPPHGFRHRAEDQTSKRRT